MRRESGYSTLLTKVSIVIIDDNPGSLELRNVTSRSLSAWVISSCPSCIPKVWGCQGDISTLLKGDIMTLLPHEGAENPEKITWTFAKFCEVVYLPVCHRKWKASTDMVEANRLEVHLVRPLGEKLMQDITRSELQALLDEKARSCGRSMVDHLRFRLRSVFALAMSEGVVDRNPAAALFTPRHYQEGRSREVLTPDQAATMIGALELREKVIVRLGTWEGMRPGEILALQL